MPLVIYAVDEKNHQRKGALDGDMVHRRGRG